MRLKDADRMANSVDPNQSDLGLHCLPRPTLMIISFRTDMPGQTVQTQIRLLLYSADPDQPAPRGAV